VVVSVIEPGASSRRKAGGAAPSDLVELLFLGQDGLPTAEQLIDVVAQAVPSCDRVCLSVSGLSRHVQIIERSDELAELLTSMQARLEEGPCFENIERNDLVHVPDIESDSRWPVFARHARDVGVRSLIAVRSVVRPRGQASLTLYADHVDAFTPRDLETATLLGSFAGLALEGDRQRDRASNLELALESNRHIGTAIGILMAREMLTSEQAFTRLRDVSQRQHRKLRDVAEEVERVGELPRDG
jgi:GAF domain-containing protein